MAFAVGSSVALPSSIFSQVIEEGMVPDFATGSWIGSPTWCGLLTGRVITSISVWLCYPSATVLISECVHPSVRGYLGNLSGL